MNASEFERAYADRSGVTVEWLRQHGRVVVPCRCGAPGCEGWASVSQENAADYAPGGIYHDAGVESECK